MQGYFREIKKDIHFVKANNLDFPSHIHDDIELVFIKEGSSTAFIDGKKYNITKNSYFLVFPNQVHRYIDCQEGEYYILIIKPSMLLNYQNVFKEEEPVQPLINNGNNLEYLLLTAFDEYNQEGFSGIIAAYLTALFGKLLKETKLEKKHYSKDTVFKIMQYIADHYKENISVDMVAKELNISRSSVSHIFSQKLSINFCDYVNSLRVFEAARLLETKTYLITEICYMVGFSTIRTFNRAFFKQYNLTPKEYRKNKAE